MKGLDPRRAPVSRSRIGDQPLSEYPHTSITSYSDKLVLFCFGLRSMTRLLFRYSRLEPSSPSTLTCHLKGSPCPRGIFRLNNHGMNPLLHPNNDALSCNS